MKRILSAFVVRLVLAWALASASYAAPTVTLTAPANHSLYHAPANITVRANAWVPAPGVVSRVEFYANGRLIGTDTTAAYSSAWNGVTAGTYTLTAKAIDHNNVATVSAPLTVTVSDTNTAPTVSLSAPASNARFVTPASITVSASAAAPEANGSVTRVDFYANGNLIGTAASAPFRIAWGGMSAGTYALSAIATDQLGATTASAARPITVSDTSTPPMVSLSWPANAAIYVKPAAITVSANAASGNANVALKKVDFYANGNLIGTGTSAASSISWGGPAPGSYTLTAVASDARGGSTTSAARTITVNASNTPPAVALTAPANNASFAAPATITVSANWAAPEANDTVAKVDFYANGTLIGTGRSGAGGGGASSGTFSISWANVAAGAYTVTALATDAQGAATTSAARSVRVLAPPTVTLAASPGVASAPASVQLTATASVPGGTLGKVDFFQGTTLIATLTNGPYTYRWTNVPAGAYSVTAVATDDQGMRSTSAAVTVTVSAAAATIYYIYTDQLNTPRAITNEAATTVWRWDNVDPFGANAPNEDPDGDNNKFVFNLRFPGQYFDKETNTHYNYFRDYDPSIGRYVQSDPIGLQGGINTYLYVKGNPVNRADPFGLRVCGSGWTRFLIPDFYVGWPLGFLDFTGPCQWHDDCYDKCGVTKAACDDGFYGRLLQVCLRTIGGPFAQCIVTASAYYEAVRLFGTSAYERAQKNCRGVCN